MMEVFVYLVLLTILVKPLGQWVYQQLESPRVGPLERVIYKFAGVDPSKEMNWIEYLKATGCFSLAGFLLCYLILRIQNLLPGNPLQLAGVDANLAFNTSCSFVSNTNWQAYGGETTMSWLSQMAALTVQNFVSAATGISVMMALARGLRRTETNKLGSFWVDLVRTTIYVLLPMSCVLTVFLVWQGVPQTLHQTGDIPVGPVASQVAIKQLGTNGGGFYSVNSAHPLENPTPLSNFVECLAILMLPAALCYTFGLAVEDRRQGWALLAAMMLLFVPVMLGCVHAEHGWEGKEVRFGQAASALWGAATTAASNGSVNSMIDSFSPLGNICCFFLMLTGEVVFGGVGCGVYGIVLCALVAVFVAGLMVGRTPEYMGKKIETFEIKMVSLAILLMPTLVLVMSAIAVSYGPAKEAAPGAGLHGLSEILYACSSMGNNNGSAMGGLSANQPFYNLVGGVVMLISRFWIILPVLAIAGSLAAKKRIPVGAGTLPTHGPLFIVWLAVVIVVVGALSFLPALALGPLSEVFLK